MSERSIVFLLPLWGKTYIEQFFARGLLTLLAPGNLPALAKNHRCIFRFLTHSENFENFSQHRLFARLSKYCDLEYVGIDDLIYPGNYSTTITLAYLRGMEHSGERYCEDWFFYLVADYLYADGAFGNLLPILTSDARGITNGNFQVIEEEVLPLIQARIDDDSEYLSIGARELIGMVLKHLHPITVASTVNQELCHNKLANRLFWRVDSQTMVGRFFLRHMLAIRPERRVAEVGASCDYSFIPEFCPSGKVVHIADSDQFTVIECQPLIHELHHIEPGPWKRGQLAASLSEWTTREHRDNASAAMLYHAGELPATVQSVLQASERWVDQLRTQLQSIPQDPRNHPYWRGAIHSAKRQELYRNAKSDAHLFEVDIENDGESRLFASLRKFHTRLVGQMPVVYPWHPEWADCRHGYTVLRDLLHDPYAKILVVSKSPYPYADWLGRYFPDRISLYHFDRMMAQPSSFAALESQQQFDHMLISINSLASFRKLAELVRKSRAHIKIGGNIMIHASNDFYRVRNDAVLQCAAIGGLSNLANDGLDLVEYRKMGGHLHRLCRMMLGLAYSAIPRNRDITLPQLAVLLALPPLYVLLFITNLLQTWQPPGRKAPLSSLYVRYRVLPL